MTSLEFESLDEEVKELLLNYKFRKATLSEPCTLKNFKECLIGLNEEFDLFNINYVFNPYVDVENGTLRPEALVKLINATWTLIHHFKNTKEKEERLSELHKKLESDNKHLLGMYKSLKEKLNNEKNESRACVASAQKVADQSNEVYQKLKETRSKLTQALKQRDTVEKCLQKKISRLQLENNKLQDRLRDNKGTYTPCSDICDSSLMQLKEREKKQQTVIAQLQINNQELLRELINLKEDLMLTGVHDMKLNHNS